MNTPTQRIAMIQKRLNEALKPQSLEIEDDGARHIGHPKVSGGHFNVTIVSEQFIGLSSIARHRLVYDAVADIMNSEIHALSIKTHTPDEN